MDKQKTVDFNFNNPLFNVILSPLALFIAYFCYKPQYTTFERGESFIFFLVVYIYASYFFQPDLDHPVNRPGKGYFPVGVRMTRWTERLVEATVGVLLPFRFAKKASKVVPWVISSFAQIWNMYWAPYSLLFTHRGLPHWPIVGTLTRVYYLFLPYITLKHFFGIKYEMIDNVINSFHIWTPSNLFFTIALPVFISDIIHSGVDLVESVVKGYNFCPPRIPRGILAKLFRFTI